MSWDKDFIVEVSEAYKQNEMIKYRRAVISDGEVGTQTYEIDPEKVLNEFLSGFPPSKMSVIYNCGERVDAGTHDPPSKPSKIDFEETNILETAVADTINEFPKAYNDALNGSNVAIEFFVDEIEDKLGDNADRNEVKSEFEEALQQDQ